MRPGPLLAARWQAVSPARRDVLLPALLALGSFVPGIAHNGVALGELPARAWDWWAVLLIGAQTLPLLAVRHRPYLTLAVVASAFAFYQCLGYSPAFGSLAILVAIGVAGFVHRPGRRAVAYLGTASYVVLSVILIARGSPERPIDFFTFFLALLVPWWVGRSWRTRNDAVALRAQHHATRAVEAERRRIAAELHDVVTHHVTAMVVQAGAGELLATLEPIPVDQRIAAGFTEIGRSGRQALSDLRELLTVLSDRSSEPAERRPQRQAISELVDLARRSGLDISFDDRLNPVVADEIPDAVHLAAFRLTQEGLTNVMKHGGTRPVQVRLSDRDGRLLVEVRSALVGSALRGSTRQPDRPGHGLLGLRERVLLLGGTFEAGPVDDQQYRLFASIPLGPVS